MIRLKFFQPNFITQLENRYSNRVSAVLTSIPKKDAVIQRGVQLIEQLQTWSRRKCGSSQHVLMPINFRLTKTKRSDVHE